MGDMRRYDLRGKGEDFVGHGFQPGLVLAIIDVLPKVPSTD
jgi:hypothetical protein